MITETQTVGAHIPRLAQPRPKAARVISEAEKEYREKVREALDWRAEVLRGGTRAVKQHLHNSLWGVMKDGQWVQRQPAWEYTPENKLVLAMICMWAAGDPAFENPPEELQGVVHSPSLQKGLYVYGAPGRGKSTICHLIADLLGFKMVSADDVVAEFDEMMVGRGGGRPLQKWSTGDWHIDDLGTERRARFAKAEDKWIMAEIMEARYRHAQRQVSPGRLIISSNIKPDGLEERYGTRVDSRMAEMCNMIVLRGPDYRRR